MREGPIVAFGEAMLRLSVPRGERLVSTRRVDVHVGGTEANVLAALAQLGWDTTWLSAVPKHELGERVRRELRSLGVGVDHVLDVPEARLGTYFFEAGVMPRPGRVVYDRAGSAFAGLNPTAIRETFKDPHEAWLQVVRNSRLVHSTGVTAALNAGVRDLLDELMSEAHEAGVPISFDVNYRSALWSPDVARPNLLANLRRAEIVFCSLRDGVVVFGDEVFAEATLPVTERSERLARAIAQQGPSTVVVSMGAEGILVLHESQAFVQAAPGMEEVIDRVGAGDALAAGVLHGYLNGDVQLGARLGSHLSGIALGQVGDLTQISGADMELGQNGVEAGLRIQR